MQSWQSLSAMLELKYLREHAQEVKKALAKKKFPVDIDAFLLLDDLRRERMGAFEIARSVQKSAGEELSSIGRSSPEFSERTARLREVSAHVKELERSLREVESRWQSAYLSIPNIPHESVPEGKSDRDNVVVDSWGDIAAVSSHAVPHYDIPWFSAGLDFARGVKVTGAGFPFYVGPMAKLVRSLIQFFLDCAAQNGYTEFLPPILVNAASATATGQLPDKEGMMYHMAVDDFFAVPTAEVPVTNFFRDEIIDESQLPLYRCAYTPCFRREAGSWGKDVRGLNRLHQFDKVELVKWVHPTQSFAELESLRRDAEGILRALKIPYRVLAICTGDIGFPHAKQYDLEVWAGGQKRWLEVSSCSNFTDFQARRANIRFRPSGGGKPEIVHTLNGSGLAVPRVLAAILENNLLSDGTVTVPEVLRTYMAMDRIGPDFS
ncbi:MAG: serine--tRNA ligase [Puniceicoccales bacterium]|jgi:seryl-tRNA synthetase|nr:serine--tRNA ligase [Puniceicoccales bacterium]